MAVGVGVNVSQDAAAFRASIDGFKDRDMRRVLAIALNRTADGVQADAIRRIRVKYKIQQRELRRGFVIRRAHANNLQALVYASGRPLNVIAFGARQTRKGISVDIKGARKVIPGSFMVTIPNNGYTGVFRRVGKSRFPIKAVRTVDVPGLFRNEIVKESLANVATDRFRRELSGAMRAIALRAGVNVDIPSNPFGD